MALLGAGLVALLASTAGAAFVGRGPTQAKFSARGPAGMAIVGTTADVKVQEDAQGMVSVSVALSNLKTGIELRDKHMREKYLEVGEYPSAVFKLKRDAIKLPAEGQAGAFDTDGALTLHGKTKPVRVHYEVKRQSGVLAVNGGLALDMTDYGIEAPSYFGVSVKPQVDVVLSFNAEDKS